jgi:hypothetical protein
MASGAVLAVWVYACMMGHSTVRRHRNILLLSGNRALILQPLIFFPPCGTVRASISCARTHHEARGQVVAKSSSPWVVYLSISLTGNRDGSLSMAPRSSHFSPHTHTHTHPSPLQLLLRSRMDFGATTPFLFPLSFLVPESARK